MSSPTELARNYVGSKGPAGYPGLPDGWYSEWETIPSSDGGKLKLFSVTHRKSKAEPKRVLLVSHGFGEHSGRYQHLPHYLAPHIDAMFAIDHRGHGRSEGQRGDATDFDLLVNDFANAVWRVKERFPTAELHVFGHSMGGHIGIRLGFLHPGLPLRTLQVSAPYLGLKLNVNAAKKAAASVLSKVWGNLSLAAGIAPEILTRDPAAQEALLADRLNHRKMTPRFFTAMNRAMKDSLSRTEGIPWPFQLMLPGDDGLVDSAVSQAWYDQFRHPRKRIVDFPDYRHEGVNEIGKEAFIQKIGEWIEEGAQR